jgi:hypothetical protein
MIPNDELSFSALLEGIDVAVNIRKEGSLTAFSGCALLPAGRAAGLLAIELGHRGSN